MKLAIGAVLTFFAVALAGQRAERITRLIASAASRPPTGSRAPGPASGPSWSRSSASASCSSGRSPGWPTSSPSGRFVILLTTIVEAYGELFTETFALPLVGHSPVLGFLQDLIAVAVLASLVAFAVIRVRESPARLGRASRFYGSHTGQAWVILGMIALVIVTLLLLPGRQGGQGHLPLRRLGVRLHGGRGAAGRAAGLDPGAAQRGLPARPPGGRARVPGAGHVLQAPAHLHRPVQRRLLPPPQGPRAAGHPPDRPRGDDRGGRLRRRQGRGPELQAAAGPGHLHRVRPLPGPVPGLEHRQAALAQAGHHRPARPPVREGPVPARRGRPRAPGRPRPGRARQGPGPRRGRVRRALVLHHLRGLRRAVPGRHRARRHHHGAAPLRGPDGVPLPRRGRHHAAQRRELRRPLGAGRRPAPGLDRGARLRGPGGRRPDPRRRRVPVLGRLRGRARGPGPQDGQGHRRACCTGPGSASPCSARASPAPATRPAASATSTSTSSRPSRTSRPSTASGRAR